MKNSFIQVKAVTKSGKDLGTVMLNLSNVLYFRDWITKDNSKLIVAYLTGGKEVVINMLPSQIEQHIDVGVCCSK